MATRWAIRGATLAAAVEAVKLLHDEVEDLEAAWDDCTERWQESERGQGVLDWINDALSCSESIRDGLDELAELDTP